MITHFARAGNISDCNAKEWNQDSGVKILGIPLAYLLIQRLGLHPAFPVAAYICLAAIQFYCTWRAVNAVKLKAS